MSKYQLQIREQIEQNITAVKIILVCRLEHDGMIYICGTLKFLMQTTLS